MIGFPLQGMPSFLAPTWYLGGLASRKSQLGPASTEAEYHSLAQTSTELTWIQALLTELHISFNTPVLYCDNQSVVSIAHNPVFHGRTKHMEIDVFFVREKVLTKQLSVLHIPSLDQWADVLTKSLSSARFQVLRDKLNVKIFSYEKSSPWVWGGIRVYVNNCKNSLQGLLAFVNNTTLVPGC